MNCSDNHIYPYACFLSSYVGRRNQLTIPPPPLITSHGISPICRVKKTHRIYNTNILNQKYPLSHNMGVNINDNTWHCMIIEKSKCRDVEWISLYLQFLFMYFGIARYLSFISLNVSSLPSTDYIIASYPPPSSPLFLTNKNWIETA